MLSVKGIVLSDRDCKTYQFCVQDAEGIYQEISILRINLPNDSLLTLFDRLSLYPKFYWRSPFTDREFIALGSVLQWKGMAVETTGAEVSKLLKQFPELKVVGGQAFYADHNPEFPWEIFGNRWWYLPRVMIERVSTGLSLTLVFQRTDLQAYRFLLQLFHCWQPVDWLLQLPEVRLLFHRPMFAHWDQQVRTVRQMIAQGVVQKVVLSRLTVGMFASSAPRISSLLYFLQQRFPETVVFCFQPDPYHAFCGATPEHLFHRKGQRLQLRAIAGTRRRSRSYLVDQQRKQELLSSRKDRQEHQYVVEAIVQALHDGRSEMIVGEPTILTLPHLYHLATDIQATIPSDVTDFRLVERLHPTPAVGGLPREVALSIIRRLEMHHRGWYAAPVGWISQMESEIAVAIRSFLLVGAMVLFYTGAGLVLTSDPIWEWQELDAKLQTFGEWFRADQVVG